MNDFLTDYSSRSLAASAINNGDIAGGSVFAADGRLYKYGNQGTAFGDLGVAGVQPVGEVEFDHYGDNDDARISRGIAALNAGEVRNLYGSGNTYRTNDGMPLITAHNFEIKGRQSMIRSDATDARVFRIGDEDNFVRRAVVDGFQVNSTNPNATGACIEIENATDVMINNVDPNDVPQYLHIGGGAKSAAITVQDARGRWRSENDLSPIFLEAGAVVKLHRVELQSPNPAPTASSILIRPKHIMDTIEIEQCKIFAAQGIGGGVDIDLTDFSVTNVWIKGNTFDRCVGPCVKVFAGGGSNNWSKHLIVAENYIRSMGDYAIEIVNAGAAADIETFNIKDNIIGAVGNGAILARKTNPNPDALMRGFRATGNTFNDDIQYVTSITREPNAVVSMSVLNGFVVGNTVKLDGFFGPLAGLNGQQFEVMEAMPDLMSVRLQGCDTTIIPTGGNESGRICKKRGAMLTIGIPARVIDNTFTARVDSVPSNVTVAAIRLSDGADVTAELNDVLTPSRLIL